MKSPVEIIVSVLESRSHEASIERIKRPVLITSNDELNARKMAKSMIRRSRRISFGDSGEADVLI